MRDLCRKGDANGKKDGLEFLVTVQLHTCVLRFRMSLGGLAARHRLQSLFGGPSGLLAIIASLRLLGDQIDTSSADWLGCIRLGDLYISLDNGVTRKNQETRVGKQ